MWSHRKLQLTSRSTQCTPGRYSTALLLLCSAMLSSPFSGLSLMSACHIFGGRGCSLLTMVRMTGLFRSKALTPVLCPCSSRKHCSTRSGVVPTVRVLASVDAPGLEGKDTKSQNIFESVEIAVCQVVGLWFRDTSMVLWKVDRVFYCYSLQLLPSISWSLEHSYIDTD